MRRVVCIFVLGFFSWLWACAPPPPVSQYPFCLCDEDCREGEICVRQLCQKDISQDGYVPPTSPVAEAERGIEGRQEQAPSQVARSQTVASPSLQAGHERFAVVIGISTYKDSRINTLRYAARDASAFYDWLVSPQGGRYAPANVKLLLDADATGKNIKNALYNWLKQALEEDVVVIYFAGHGSPESPDSPNNLYLLPYDTEYDNIASTGYPMWDIETALKRFIKAGKVIVIADACHSGGVGQTFDIAHRANRGVKVNAISEGLQSLSGVGDGVCVISASGDRQLSQEGQQWGGGHGVFTYHLLQGLNGAADYDKDNRVSLGEIVPYLSQQVRRATRNAQCPNVAGKFDPALSLER